MATYRNTSTGQVHETVDGSVHDKRLAKSADHVKVDRKPDPTPARPSKSASKDTWAAYAAQAGVPSYQITGASKDDLIDAVHQLERGD